MVGFALLRDLDRARCHQERAQVEWLAFLPGRAGARTLPMLCWTVMRKDLTGRLLARRFFFAVCLSLLATNTVFGRTTTERQLAIPAYGDSSVRGVYFRRLQDTTALRWYQEITYYSDWRAYSRGV